MKVETLEEINSRFKNDQIYPLYKDELRQPFVRKNAGYMGVVIYDSQNDLVMCPECGQFYKEVARHAHKAHRYESVNTFRKAYGLAYYIPLASRSTSALRRKMAVKAQIQRKGKPFRFPKGGTPWNKGKRVLGLTKATSTLNKYGLCSDAQVKQRLQILANIVGHSPSIKEAKKYDCYLVDYFQRKYRSWNKGKEELGFKIYKAGSGALTPRTYTDEQLLAFIRKFAIEKRKIPTTKDFKKANGVPAHTTYQDRFGSWNKAMALAGVLAQESLYV